MIILFLLIGIVAVFFLILFISILLGGLSTYLFIIILNNPEKFIVDFKL